ncbi:NB-ARC domain-containing protein [Paractinoplanes lichenicola]|uniref:NB-ARC domain-containing protein n=1 Tax=Paractinoplanes lichenicola TaxID=2802976 RepID=A0ABS1VT31_9ACTN|nr:NB-ARC domain-containing protein [Actinoplanes lichenicola]MBL7257620.1 hypothetical protein [Actinoplanes lichenicola]
MSGAATNAGIDFQARVGAFVMADALATFAGKRLPWSAHRVESIHFETGDAVDDLVVRTSGPTALIQAKHSLSFSTKPGSEFSRTVEQFAERFRQAPDADELYVLATSPKASRAVTVTLAKLTRAARLNRSGPAANPLTQEETRVYRGLAAKWADVDALLRRIHVVVFDVRARGDLEMAATNALGSASVWSALITKGLELASERLSIDAAALTDLVGSSKARERLRSLPYLDEAVERPELMARLLRAMRGGTVTAITGVHGTGGFGKTTLVRQLCDRPEIRREFDAVLWVTLGEAARGAVLAAHLNDVVEQVTGERPALTDPQQAGFRLGRALDPGRTLLVIDDVWRPAQLRPFLSGGAGCTRVVTTRSLDVVSLASAELRVDRMEPAESEAVLAREVKGVSPYALAGLSRITGRWPVLLNIANRALRRRIRFGADPGRAVEGLISQLEARGPAALDIASASAREESVAATVDAGLSLISARAAERYQSLAVFAEDARIPFSLLAAFWATDQADVADTCLELAELSLVGDLRLDTGTIQLHDVLRQHLRGHDREWLRQLNDRLVTAAAPGPWWTLPAGQHYLRDNLMQHLCAAGRNAEGLRVVTDPRWAQERILRDGVAAYEADLGWFGDLATEALRSVVQRNGHLLDPLDPPGSVGAVLLSRTPVGVRVREPHLRARTPLPDLPHPALRRVLPGHPNGVSEVVAAGDGSWFATVDGFETVSVWDARDGQRLWTVDVRSHGGPSFDTAFSSADSRWLITTQPGWPGAGMIRVWNARTGRPACTIPTAPVPSVADSERVAVAPSGNLLAVAVDADDGAVRLYDLVTGTLLAALKSGQTRAIAFAPDGRLLATGDWRTESHPFGVHLWDVGKGRLLRSLTKAPGAVRDVAFSEDSELVAATDNRGSLQVWRSRDGEQIYSTILKSTWSRVAFAARGHVITYSDSGPVEVHDTAAIRNRYVLAPDVASPAIAVPRTGEWIAVAEAEPGGLTAVRILSRSGRLIDELPGHSHGVRAMAATPAGSLLLTGDGFPAGVVNGDRAVRVWTMEGRGRRSARPQRRCVAVSPDGRFAAHHGQSGVWLGAVEADEPLALVANEDYVDSACFGPDGSWLVVAGTRVKVIDLADGAVRLRLPATEARPTSVVALPDNSSIVTCSQPSYARDANRQRQYAARVWDLTTGQQRFELAGHDLGVRHCVADPSGNLLVTTDGSIVRGRDTGIHVWQLAGGTRRHRLSGLRDGVGAVVCGPDGGWLAAGEARMEEDDDCRAVLFDLTRGTRLGVLGGHRGAIPAIAASSDGRHLVTGDTAGVLRLWSRHDLRLRHELRGRQASITAIVGSPDDRWLAVADDGGGVGAVRIVDPLAGQVVTAMRVDGPLRGCAWFPDGSGLSAWGPQGFYTFDWR